jgi:hypothetical protein
MKAIACLLLLTAAHASAAFSIVLPGNTETGTWSNLYFSATTNPTPPALNSLIAASGSSAAFMNDTGTATYTSTGSGVYGGQSPNEYSVVDNSPILDLATIVFQARTNLDFASITLTLNGAVAGPLAGIVPDFALSELSPEAGRFDRAWQWDLSGISEEITSYEISITTAAHTVLYSTSPLTVQTSNSFVQAVPEPTTGLLAVAPLALVILRRRRAA